MSKGTGSAMFLTMLVVLFVLTFLLPQMGRGSHRHRSRRPLLYDTATEVTVSGTVLEFRLIAAERDVQRNQAIPWWGVWPSVWTGTHLSLRVDTGTLRVNLAPAPYLESKHFSVANGDELTITGSRVGNELLIAKEIRKGGQILRLRDEQGLPLWSGFARRLSEISGGNN